MEDRIKVLSFIPLQKEDDAAFRARLPFADIRLARRDELTPRLAAWPEVVFGFPPADRLDEFVDMRWLQLNSAGTDPYTDPGVLPAGVALTNAAGAYNDTISEYLLGAVLCHLQNMPALARNQRAHRWKEAAAPVTLKGAGVLVAGLGNIGTAFAQKAKLLGAETVVGLRRNTENRPDDVDAVYPLAQLAEQLPQADVVVSMLPGSPDTRGLFDAAMFARFKPGSVFVNVGRGSAVDLDALVAALASGKLRGATLDVTEPEPLPAKHPAWDAPNLVITPHISGGWRTFYDLRAADSLPLQAMLDIFVDNLHRYRDGQPLRNLVPTDGQRTE